MFEADSHLLWVTAVEVPVLGALFWLVWRNRRDTDDRLEETQRRADIAVSQSREALAAFKLEVARSYASISTLKDVEARLTAHLLRIETKLDETRRRALELND
jgi:phage shock protein A